MTERIRVEVLRDSTSMGDDAVNGIGPYHYDIEPSDNVADLLQRVLANMHGMPRPEGPWTTDVAWAKAGPRWTASVNGVMVALLARRRIEQVRPLPCAAQAVERISFHTVHGRNSELLYEFALRDGPGSAAYEFAVCASEVEERLLVRAVVEGWSARHLYRFSIHGCRP